MLNKVRKIMRAVAAPLTSELGAVPANEGMALGYVGAFALALVIGVGALAPASAYSPINCHGCWLSYPGDCATYDCDENEDLCPTYPPIAKYTVEAWWDGWPSQPLYCSDQPYFCAASCNPGCGSCN